VLNSHIVFPIFLSVCKLFILTTFNCPIFSLSTYISPSLLITIFEELGGILIGLLLIPNTLYPSLVTKYPLESRLKLPALVSF